VVRGTLPGMDKLQAKPSGPSMLMKVLGIDIAAIEQQSTAFVTALVAQMKAMDEKLDRIEKRLDEIQTHRPHVGRTDGDGTHESATGTRAS